MGYFDVNAKKKLFFSWFANENLEHTCYDALLYLQKKTRNEANRANPTKKIIKEQKKIN